VISCQDSREVYLNRWMRVREDAVQFPNGAQGIYGVVEKPDFVAIVPIDTNKRIHLVQQYRYPVGGRYWEIPQGSWEDKPGTDPEVVAMAELREETGLRAGRLVRVGHLFQAYGFSNQGYHLYVATELEQGQATPETTESDMISQGFTISEVRQMIMGGEIKDATTVAAFGYLLLATEFVGFLE
jgi:ADP-ribose pyrophosphatase